MKAMSRAGSSSHVSSDVCFCCIHTSWISTTHFQTCQTQFCPTYLTQSCKYCPSCVFHQLTVFFWHHLIPLCCIKCKLFIFAFHGTFPTSLPVRILTFALSKMSNSSGHSLIFFKQAHYCFLPCCSVSESTQLLPLFSLYLMTILL